MIFNPSGGAVRVEAGDLLIAIGRAEALMRVNAIDARSTNKSKARISKSDG